MTFLTHAQKKNTELHCLVKTQRYQTYLFVQQCMLGVVYYPRTQNALWHETFDCHHCWDSYSNCWCLCVWVNVLMHYNFTIFFRRPDNRNIAGFHFEDSHIYEIPIHLKLIHRTRSENHTCQGWLWHHHNSSQKHLIKFLFTFSCHN